VGTTEGIVVYMARKTVDIEKLVQPTNEEYLAYSSILIGSAYAMQKPRLAAARERHLESFLTMKRVKKKMQTLNAMKRNVESFIEEESNQKKVNEMSLNVDGFDDQTNKNDSIFEQAIDLVYRKAKSSYKKSFGAAVAPP
jgi:hypothetical protein